MPFKYLTAYLIPLSAWLSLFSQGLFAWTTPILIFGFVPLLEAILKPKLSSSIPNKAFEKLYDLFLYFNLFFVYATLILFGLQTYHTERFSLTWLGWLFSTGIVLGANGINVAHELGHRKESINQWFARLLLLPSFYMHFTKEHNKGHHRYVATPLDPATARKNEWLILFWLRSSIGCYLNAWRIQKQELKTANRAFLSLKNDMLLFTIFEISYMILIFLLSSSWFVLLSLTMSGIIGFLLLETINYIEHYGLARKKLSENRWEKVQPWHSWNADYDIGRILLFELTLHSDHHYKATKKYPYLQNLPTAPKLPLGYPASMLIAFFSPLWFYLMNPRLPSNTDSKHLHV